MKQCREKKTAAAAAAQSKFTHHALYHLCLPFFQTDAGSGEREGGR